MSTSLLAGRLATEHNQVLLARNEDALRNNWNKYLTFRSEPEYLAIPDAVDNGYWTLGNGLRVPVPDVAYSYSAMPDTAVFSGGNALPAKRFFFEARGVNQHHVALSAANALAINSRVAAIDPLVVNAVDEAIIPALILPQASSARQAVVLLGEYIEQYGAGEVNGVLLADPDEAWYLEIGSGHHWIAVCIPDDAYLVVANGMRVHGVDLDSPKVLHSNHLFEFVCQHHLLELADRHSFNFAQAFGIVDDRDNDDRIWLAQHLLSPTINQSLLAAQYPLFLRPDHKISVRDVMALLRADYTQTPLEGIATRFIGTERTAESHIICLDASMPDPLKSLIWQAVGTPLGAPFMPLYSVMQEIPGSYAFGSNEFNPFSAYWAFRGLYALAASHNGHYQQDVLKLWQRHEQQWINGFSYMQTLLRDLYVQVPNIAVDFARNYSTGIAFQAVSKANWQRNLLMTQLAESEGHK